MTRDDGFIGQLESYFDEYEGSTPLPEDVRDAIRAQLPSTQQRPAWWPPRRIPEMNQATRIALAAAAVVAVALIGFSFLGGPNVGGPNVGGPDEPGSSQQPGASISADLPLLVDQDGSLEPGQYVVTEVEPLRIGITVPAGWSRNIAPATVWIDGSAAHIWFGRVENLYADPCAEGLLDPPVGPSADALATALAGLPGVEASSESLTVSGYSGAHVELAVADPIDGWCGADSRLWDIERGEVFAGPNPFGLVHVWIFDVDGDRLVLAAEVRSGAGPDDVAGLEGIIESLQIQAP